MAVFKIHENKVKKVPLKKMGFGNNLEKQKIVEEIFEEKA